ncbi:MAG: cobalamin B12-binding domain-containing protein [candidate division WOR-3 bacterium]|nr:MAG: cobalamin B12-binding domain-containing protein [candidate division WOR-3 bacterium]
MVGPGKTIDEPLSAEAAKLPKPSESSVRLLRDELPRLLKTVGDKLTIDERYECGAIPCEQLDFALQGNRAFGHTLLGIFETGLMELLPQEFIAFATALRSRGAEAGFFSTMLRVWIGTIHATITDPEAEELARPLEWLGQNLDRLDAATSGPMPALTAEQRQFLDLLLAHRRREAAEFALRALDASTVESALNGLVVPVLEHAGLCWQANELTVAQEHAATEICRYVVFRVFDSAPRSKSLPYRAMVVCAPGEEHELGAEMMAAYLEHKGWEVLFVGHSTPADDILRTAETVKPDLVMISVTIVANLPAAVLLAREFRRRQPDVRLVAGGRAAVAGRRVVESEVDAIAADIEEGYRAAVRLAED